MFLERSYIAGNGSFKFIVIGFGYAWLLIFYSYMKNQLLSQVFWDVQPRLLEPK